MWEDTDKEVDLIIDELGLKQISDSNEIDEIVDEVIKTNSAMVEEFKSGKLRALVATDLLARGIDIEFLPHVINYELPRSPKDYVHRIGRTGRAEASGEAISLISPDEEHHFKVIQKKMKISVELMDGNQVELK